MPEHSRAAVALNLRPVLHAAEASETLRELMQHVEALQAQARGNQLTQHPVRLTAHQRARNLRSCRFGCSPAACKSV